MHFGSIGYSVTHVIDDLWTTKQSHAKILGAENVTRIQLQNHARVFRITVAKSNINGP